LQELLAVLLLSPNEPVSAERLTDALFGEQAPPTAPSTMRVHISRLRRALGDDPELVTTSAAGYRLRVLPGELDADRFSERVEAGRALLGSDPERASAVLRDALALWRGDALADFTFRAFAQAEIARLGELRLTALELRIDADLAAGRADVLIPELHGLVEQHPLRERLHGQLMLALYRCGRQAEALEVFQRLRGALVDELGIEPSSELHEIQGAILRHDATVGPAAPRRPSRPSRPSRRVLALMALGTIAGVAAGMIALAGPEGRNSPEAAPPGGASPGGGAAATGGAAAAETAAAEYQDEVVEVCERMNRSFRVLKRDTATLRSRLRRARTTRAQRDAILILIRIRIERGGHNLAALRSLEPPPKRAQLHAQTEVLWERNLDVFRAYAVRLDRVSNRRELLRAIGPLTSARPALDKRFVSLKAGLQKLGGDECEIDLYVERPVPLPPLHHEPTPSPSSGGSGSSAGGSSAPDSINDPGSDASGGTTGGSTGSVTGGSTGGTTGGATGGSTGGATGGSTGGATGGGAGGGSGGGGVSGDGEG
jgi:DNA-binding SARP family transcriptional activator